MPDKSDVEVAESILGVIDASIGECIVETKRLGRSRSSRSRPLRVRLKIKNYATSLLRKKRKLLDSEYHNIVLTDDKTSSQNEELNKLRAKLRTRESEGQTNIIGVKPATLFLATLSGR